MTGPRIGTTRVPTPRGDEDFAPYRIINDNFDELRDQIMRLSLTNGLIVVGDIQHGLLAELSEDDHEQYHTDARALIWLGTRSTTDLSEGTNLYWTDTRFDTRFATRETLQALASAADQGDIVYYNGSAWVRLAPGSDGDVLTTGGAAANPTWETPAAGGGGSFAGYIGTGTMGFVWVAGLPLRIS